MSKPYTPSDDAITVLSHLLLSPHDSETSRLALEISREKVEDLLGLANTNHVIVRGLEVFITIAYRAREEVRAGWVATALAAERYRIEKAISFLHAVCAAFEEEGYDATVIKSLDHWPDLGSDLDLYSNAKPADICTLMQRRFDAKIASRSWGDRPIGPDWRTGFHSLLAARSCPICRDRQLHISSAGRLGPFDDFRFATHVPPPLFSLVRHCRYSKAVGFRRHQLRRPAVLGDGGRHLGRGGDILGDCVGLSKPIPRLGTRSPPIRESVGEIRW
jgi:hypothetical protein